LRWPAGCVPRRFCCAPPSRCNAEAVAAPWGTVLPALRRDELIAGASNCYFESPTDWVSSLACGDTHPARQQQVRQGCWTPRHAGFAKAGRPRDHRVQGPLAAPSQGHAKSSPNTAMACPYFKRSLVPRWLPWLLTILYSAWATRSPTYIHRRPTPGLPRESW